MLLLGKGVRSAGAQEVLDIRSPREVGMSMRALPPEESGLASEPWRDDAGRDRAVLDSYFRSNSSAW